MPVIFVALSHFLVETGNLYLLFFASLARGLLILLIFSNNQFLLSLIFSIALFSILMISAFLISGTTNTSPALPPQGRRDLKLLPAHFRGAWVPEHPPELPDSRELFLVWNTFVALKECKLNYLTLPRFSSNMRVPVYIWDFWEIDFSA